MPDPTPIKPDTDFLHRILAEGGEDLKQCYQCATCSVVCELSTAQKPFPRKEMIWAQWGLKDRLVADPDIWLCHQCNDCSTRCPRGARPGDVLAALRQENVEHYAVPRFLGRWMNQPKFLPVLLAIPAVLLGLLVWAPIENGLVASTRGAIAYSCWRELPHWALISFFTFFSVLVVLAVMAGVVQFWRAMKAADAQRGITMPANGLASSIGSVLKNIVMHDKFTQCTEQGPRLWSHLCVFYGFIALCVVALWVVAVILFGPLVRNDLIYPFSYLNPWRILANLGGIAIVAGCGLMILDRLRDRETTGANTFSDWTFLGLLLGVVVTGLVAEGLHYARLEPHRLVAYFLHLVLVFALLVYLPYCKFAHLIYRTTAMVYAEYSGRNTPAPVTAVAGDKREVEEEEKDQAEKGNE